MIDTVAELGVPMSYQRFDDKVKMTVSEDSGVPSAAGVTVTSTKLLPDAMVAIVLDPPERL